MKAKATLALVMTAALGWCAGEARAQQKQADKEKLELLQEELEGADIRMQIGSTRFVRRLNGVCRTWSSCIVRA